MQSVRPAEKAFRRKLADGSGRATCRKQQEKGWCVLACSLIQESMHGEQAREWGKGGLAEERIE